MPLLTNDQKLILETTYNDLFKFVEVFLPNNLTSKTPDFHREIYKLLPDTSRLVLAAPRGFAKSFIVSRFYPLWLALMMKRKDIVIISASETLAIEHLRWIKRELETNQDLLKFFGRKVSEKWTENHIILKNEDMVNIRARGAGGQIRGFRPDCIVLDDIETDESVVSEEQRTKLRDWIYKACINALTPDGQFLMIGTVIHPLALLCEFLETEREGWIRKRYKAYLDGIQEKGKELWADLWSHERLQRQKADIGSFAFSSEFLNDPKMDGNAPIQDKHIRYWKDLPEQYSCVICLDPAYSDDEKSDYKVACVVAIDNNQNRYLLEYIRTHKPSGEFIDAALNLYIKYKDVLTGFGVPCQGTEKEFYKSVTEKAQQRMLYPPFVELKNVYTTADGKAKTNKQSRIVASLQPIFEQGKYYIHPSQKEAKEELLTIGSSRWDDLVDAMCYCEMILQPVYFDLKEQAKWVEEQEEINRGSAGYGIDD